MQVVGNARVMARKLEVPRCISCDLPLLDSKRRFKYMDAQDAGVGGPAHQLAQPSVGSMHSHSGYVDKSTIHSSASVDSFTRGSVDRSTIRERPATSNVSNGVGRYRSDVELGGGNRPGTSSAFMHDGTGRVRPDLRDQRGGKPAMGGGPGGSSGFIMRGGFRMPKTQVSDTVLTALNFPGGEEQQNGRGRGGAGLARMDGGPEERGVDSLLDHRRGGYR